MNAQIVKEYIAGAYGHVIPYNAEITGSELSERIREQYDPAEPHNHYAIEVTAELGGRWSKRGNGEITWRN